LANHVSYLVTAARKHSSPDLALIEALLSSLHFFDMLRIELIPVFSQCAGNFNILHEYEKIVKTDNLIRPVPINVSPALSLPKKLELQLWHQELSHVYFTDA